MKSRWITEINNLNFTLHEVKRLTKKLIRSEKGRGRPPKHNPTSYAEIIVLKEFEKYNLRKAEVRLTTLIVGERVDHSVINYWKRKPELVNWLKIIISRAGKLLDKFLTEEHTFVDATKFSSWKIEETEFHVCNKIAKETIYPVGVSFITSSVLEPVKEIVPDGEGDFLTDAWYDERKTIEFLFKKGYEPLICPNKRRSRGHYRRKSRKLYKQRRGIYKQRGRGESMFGSLTNEFGDRIKAINNVSMRVRILARIISYQIKLLIRCDGGIINIEIIIFRHAPPVKTLIIPKII